MNFLIRVAIIIGSIERAVFGIFTGCFSFLDPLLWRSARPRRVGRITDEVMNQRDGVRAHLLGFLPVDERVSTRRRSAVDLVCQGFVPEVQRGRDRDQIMRFRSHGAGDMERALAAVAAEPGLLEFRTDAQRRDESLLEAAITADARNLKYARFYQILKWQWRRIARRVRDLLSAPAVDCVRRGILQILWVGWLVFFGVYMCVFISIAAQMLSVKSVLAWLIVSLLDLML